mgnify:CR=1 FL=1|jgi:hypothetical protein
MKLLLENWRQYLDERYGMIVYRGVSEGAYVEFMRTGRLPLSKDIIPRDSEVMNYALERGFIEERDMPQWAKDATTGINATKDPENAEGYGRVIAMEVVGDEFVELPGGYVFIKDYDQVRVIE